MECKKIIESSFGDFLPQVTLKLRKATFLTNYFNLASLISLGLIENKSAFTKKEEC